MTACISETLPIARYRLAFRAESSFRLPFYTGSALRGMFGHALRRLSCMTRARSCEGCPLLQTCPYSLVFEPPAAEAQGRRLSQLPAPYIIEPPALGGRTVAADESFAFSLVLWGPALAQLPLVVYAWQQAFARGIGSGRHRAILQDVHWQYGDQWQRLYTAGDSQLQPHTPRLTLQYPARLSAACLHIETPLRLQRQGALLGVRDINALDLLSALARRINLLDAAYFGRPEPWDNAAVIAAAGTLDTQPTLRWCDWTRYSSRQQQPMSLGGVVGQWRLQGNLDPFARALYLGQWLHAGKNTTFGLGRYRLAQGNPEGVRHESV